MNNTLRNKPHIFLLLLFLLIVTIFLSTRLFALEKVPAALYWDEASIGYNAYSILKTGRDEWGAFLPIHFKAFGEYKLPVYIYTTALFESILGLTPTAVRLPAVLFSLGSVMIIFLITKQLFKSKKLGLIASFFLVIMPWFFIFSRTGYEVTAGLFFFLLGLYFFFLSEKKYWFLISSSASFLLAIYSYNSFRILIPFLGIGLLLFLLLKKRLLEKQILIPAILAITIFAIGSIPIINLINSADGLERLNEVSIYHPGDSRKEALITFSQNYFSHFNPYFLFLTGDPNLRSHTGTTGQLFWLCFPFIIIGIIFCLKYHKPEQLFILFLLLIAPIPASVTKESPHALRAILMVAPLVILTAIGLEILCKKIRYKNNLLISILLVFSFLFMIYYYKFINDYPKQSAQEWQNEYRQIFETYADGFARYDHVVISDRYAQPYIFYAFYRNIDPVYFQQNRQINELPRRETSLVKKIGNVIFDDVILEKLPNGRLLLFAHPEEELKDLRPIQTIWNPDKSVAFYVYEVEKNDSIK